MLDTMTRKCLNISGPCIQPVTDPSLCSAGKVELFLWTKIRSLSWQGWNQTLPKFALNFPGLEDWVPLKMLLVGDEWDFIAAGNDCRVVTNLACLCLPPGPEHAVPLCSLVRMFQGQPQGEVSAGKQPRAISWKLADGFLLPNRTEVSEGFLLCFTFFLLLLENLFLRVT